MPYFNKTIIRFYYLCPVVVKDSKQFLGIGQYQNISYEAAVKPLYLVCLAYALLTHVAITREGAQGKQKSTARLSTAKPQNEVRRIVWDDLTDYINSNRVESTSAKSRWEKIDEIVVVKLGLHIALFAVYCNNLNAF